MEWCATFRYLMAKLTSRESSPDPWLEVGGRVKKEEVLYHMTLFISAPSSTQHKFVRVHSVRPKEKSEHMCMSVKHAADFPPHWLCIVLHWQRGQKTFVKTTKTLPINHKLLATPLALEKLGQLNLRDSLTAPSPPIKSSSNFIHVLQLL